MTAVLHDSAPGAIVAAGLYYAKVFDMHVFPINSHKTPFKGSRGFYDAVEDPDEIRALFRRYPAPALAASTGTSLLCVIDLDNHDGTQTAFDWWAQKIAEHGIVKTATAQTPSGGLHIYFNSPELREMPSSNGKLAPGVDVKADNAYIILPPSRTSAGVYRWKTPPEAGIADCPPWLIRLIAPPDKPPARPTPRPLPRFLLSDRRRNAYLHAVLENEIEALMATPAGRQNNQLNLAAYRCGRFVPAGLSEEIASGVLLEAALALGQEPAKSRSTIKSGIVAGQRKPKEIPT